MLTEERHQKILQLLDQKSVVKLQELANLLNTSESAIRRGLQELENANLLERIHDGAKRTLNLGFEQNMTEKSIKNTHGKQKIASLAVSYAQDGDAIYLDAGSTTLEMIPFLAGEQIHVVTNSVHHAAKLSGMEVPTIMLGSTLKLSTKAIIDTTSMEQLQHSRFNKAFLGTNGAHLEFGLTAPGPGGAALKALTIHQAETAYVLLDHTKFNRVTFTKVEELESVTLLTDYCPAESFRGFQQKTILTEAGK